MTTDPTPQPVSAIDWVRFQVDKQRDLWVSGTKAAIDELLCLHERVGQADARVADLQQHSDNQRARLRQLEQHRSTVSRLTQDRDAARKELAALREAARFVLSEFKPEHMDAQSGTKCGTNLCAAIAASKPQPAETQPLSFGDISMDDYQTIASSKADRDLCEQAHGKFFRHSHGDVRGVVTQAGESGVSFVIAGQYVQSTWRDVASWLRESQPQPADPVPAHYPRADARLRAYAEAQIRAIEALPDSLPYAEGQANAWRMVRTFLDTETCPSDWLNSWVAAQNVVPNSGAGRLLADLRAVMVSNGACVKPEPVPAAEMNATGMAETIAELRKQVARQREDLDECEQLDEEIRDMLHVRDPEDTLVPTRDLLARVLPAADPERKKRIKEWNEAVAMMRRARPSPAAPQPEPDREVEVAALRAQLDAAHKELSDIYWQTRRYASTPYDAALKSQREGGEA